VEVDRVAAPDGDLQLVGVVHVAQDDHGARVPMLLFVVEVTEISNGKYSISNLD
jgi:hypothetical protein